MKINFDAFLTWHKNDYNYINILPRMTVFVSPIYDGSINEPDGRMYSLQIGWLCFEVSLSVERRRRDDSNND